MENPTVMILFVTLLGLFLIGAAVKTLLWYHSTASWRLAAGRVLRSWIREQSPELGTASTLYEPEVEYEYTVDSRLFTGYTVSFEDLVSSDPRIAQRIVHDYPSGAMVNVLYDPAQPDHAVLERHINRVFIGLMLVLGVVITLIGLVGLVYTV